MQEALRLLKAGCAGGCGHDGTGSSCQGELLCANALERLSLQSPTHLARDPDCEESSTSDFGGEAAVVRFNAVKRSASARLVLV
jgi:hypothetical protein